VVLLVVLVASIGAVLMSNSRGSSIGLGAAILFLVWHSKRRLLTVVILAIAIGPAFYLVGDQYLNRMSTIRTYEDDESAANRVDLWHTAWELSQQHPLLGVGFGGRNFAVLEAQYRHDSKPTAVHNSYLSMLVGSGVFAFGLYVTLLFGTIAWLGRCARRLKAEDVAACYAARAIQIALVAYAVGGTFYSHERYDFMYMLLMAAAAFYCVEREHAVEVWQSAEPKLSAVVPSWRTGSLSEHRAQP
jgi:O-antigen ligase